MNFFYTFISSLKDKKGEGLEISKEWIKYSCGELQKIYVSSKVN